MRPMLSGIGENFELLGNAGDDTILLGVNGAPGGAGKADGGEGSDEYHVWAVGAVEIKDLGTSGYDEVFLHQIDVLEYNYDRFGNDLVFYTDADASDGTISAGVIFTDWYAGANTIERIWLAENTQYFDASHFPV